MRSFLRSSSWSRLQLRSRFQQRLLRTTSDQFPAKSTFAMLTNLRSHASWIYALWYLLPLRIIWFLQLAALCLQARQQAAVLRRAAAVHRRSSKMVTSSMILLWILMMGVVAHTVAAIDILLTAKWYWLIYCNKYNIHASRRACALLATRQLFGSYQLEVNQGFGRYAAMYPSSNAAFRRGAYMLAYIHRQ